MEYDSTKDTTEHIKRVQELLSVAIDKTFARRRAHDQSKLESPEKEAFDEFTPKLKKSTYGSEEYKEFLAQMKPALDHHYANNSHHPEHYRWHCSICCTSFSAKQYEDAPQGPNDSGKRYCPRCCSNGMIYEADLEDRPDLGINGMTLLDLIEMLCDWKAAGERHADGSMERSLMVNQERFHIGEQLQSILENTARELGLL